MISVACLTYYQIKTNPGSKVIEFCTALGAYNINITLLTTSNHSRIKIKKYKLNNITIVEFPDLLWGKFRQGIDFLNTLLRFWFLIKNDFDIIHLIDCRPVTILPAFWAKKIKKTPLVISW